MAERFRNYFNNHSQELLTHDLPYHHIEDTYEVVRDVSKGGIANRTGLR